MIDQPATDLPPLPPMERLVELLFDAARTGRDDVIPALLRAGVDVEVLNDRGHSPLIVASYNGQADTTALLLREGARPDGPDGFDGNTALMGVAFKGYVEIARLLLDAGAVPDRTNAVGQTALMTAALFGRTEIIDLLLARGADPAVRDGAGNTAATLARAQGNGALADRLASDAG